MADVKSVLKTIFPFLSAAASLGGPPAVLAAQVLGKALGADGAPVQVDPTESGIMGALAKANASPDQVLAAQKAELEFQIEKAKLEPQHQEELERIAAADRDSARKREMAVKDTMPGQLAWLAVLSLMGCILLIAFGNLDGGARDAVLTLTGFVGASYKDVYGYFFGSSSGQDKAIQNGGKQ